MVDENIGNENIWVIDNENMNLVNLDLIDMLIEWSIVYYFDVDIKLNFKF